MIVRHRDALGFYGLDGVGLDDLLKRRSSRIAEGDEAPAPNDPVEVAFVLA